MSDEAYHICTLPAGTDISEIEAPAPSCRSFRFRHPDGTIQTLDAGPFGVTLTEFRASDVTFSVGTK